MGLENLKSVFDNIGKNSTIDPVSGVNSPVSDLSQDASSFKQTPFTQIDSVFANKSIRLIGGESLIDTEIEHTFGTQGENKDLIKINNIDFRQADSPQTKQERIKITAEEIKINKIKKTGEGGLFQMLGVNSQLGKGVFNWSSLYNSNHTPIEERIPIDIGKKDHNGNPILINTLRSGMGALSNLDIMGYRSGLLDNFRGFDRGNEPYEIQPIGSDRYTMLTNRDGWPIHRALDDVSRLAKFYTSGAGVSFLAKENITNLWSAAPNNNPLMRLLDQTKQDLVPKVEGNWNSKILFPPLPNPYQGNTGFLNQSNQHRDLGSQIGSLRKGLVIEYSKRTNLPLLPFGFLGDNPIPNPTPGQDPIFEKATKTKPRFLGLGNGPRWRDDDKISTGGVLKPGTLPGGISDLPPLEYDMSDPIQTGDFYVRFKDMRNNNFIYFRGYVTGITENLTPSYNSVNYVGRSESTYNYERTERDLSFNLRILPANNKQFKTMWEKINYLTSLTYPEYMEDKNFTRMKAPFTELYMGHIGTSEQGQFGFIKSLSYSVNESGDWDQKTRLPRVIDVAISYQILNKKTPSLFKSNDTKTLDNLTEFYNLPS